MEASPSGIEPSLPHLQFSLPPSLPLHESGEGSRKSQRGFHLCHLVIAYNFNIGCYRKEHSNNDILFIIYSGIIMARAFFAKLFTFSDSLRDAEILHLGWKQYKSYILLMT